ncbi:hypothetical protein Lfu02_41600 [Longispora fulva]|uniref:Serine protease n=1 Tax=Longispora fulva TaxID=619741 RepID=A0A8J7GPK7_9ACTN|nr:Ig domain-containing protein [Longispora fulva]MBG6136619.1 serine protease [Longispora fulva]GIG59788.1 hypothetical protein Lfu02_41600 [Longispora fulva]
MSLSYSARRLGFAGVAALAVAAGSLTLAHAASAGETNPYCVKPAHGHSMPTVPAAVYRSTGKCATGSAAPSPGNMTYHGGTNGVGVSTGAEKIYVVFYGTQWGTTGTDANGYTTFTGDPKGMAPRLQALYKGIGTNGELWSGVMTQFCEGVATGATTCPATSAHVAYPASTGTLAGVWYDNSAASPTTATGQQLATEANKAAGHFGNTTNAANRNAQYIIVSPTGTHPDGFNSTGQFCAWHDWSGAYTGTTNGDFAFTNAPYVTDMGASCGANVVNAGTAGTLDGVTEVMGHEYAETITDQFPVGSGSTLTSGGWIRDNDSSGGENGDKCSWVGAGAGDDKYHNVAFSTGSFAMQPTWGNDGNSGSGSCQMTHAIVTNGTGGNTVTVTNPGSQSGTVGTAVSKQISATDSASGATLTYSATGLPTGLSISASGLISGTPSAAGSYNVVVTVTDQTNASGTASFTWTISGTGGGCTGAGQKLGNPGFESGNTVWTASSGVIDNGTTQPAHGGSWKAWLDGYGSAHTDTLSQSVTVPSGCSSYTLSFYLHIDTAETGSTVYDKLTVQIGTTTLATYSNVNAANGYVLRSFDLSAYAGQTVTLKFTGTEDSSLKTSFVIDDAAVTVS